MLIIIKKRNIMKDYLTYGGVYLPPTCKVISLMQSGRLCVVSDGQNSRGQVSVSGMSGSWDAED